jgi:hypothetical protein
MAAACDLSLVLHGAIVLLLGQVAGYAFFWAINARDPQGREVGMWRMSHAACSAGAVLLIALAPVVPHLRLDPKLALVLTYSLIVSTHALCVGTVVAAWSGHRGTRLRGPMPNLAVYLLYIVGALGSTLSALVFAYGAAGAYFAPSAR